MAITYTEQYRPVSDTETDTNDGLSIRAVRDMEEALNNYQRHVGLTKSIGQPCIPHWQSEDSTNTDENLLVPPFAPFVVPDAADSLAVSLGCYQTVAGGGDVDFTLYATTSLYRGSGIIMDTTLLVHGYTSLTLTTSSATHDIEVGQLTIPKTLQGVGHVPVLYLVLTAQNDNTNRASVTSIDVTPEHT